MEEIKYSGLVGMIKFETFKVSRSRGRTFESCECFVYSAREVLERLHKGPIDFCEMPENMRGNAQTVKDVRKEADSTYSMLEEYKLDFDDSASRFITDETNGKMPGNKSALILIERKAWQQAQEMGEKKLTAKFLLKCIFASMRRAWRKAQETDERQLTAEILLECIMDFEPTPLEIKAFEAEKDRPPFYSVEVESEPQAEAAEKKAPDKGAPDETPFEYSALTEAVMKQAKKEQMRRGRSYLSYEFVLRGAVQVMQPKKKLTLEEARLNVLLNDNRDSVSRITQSVTSDPSIGTTEESKRLLDWIISRARKSPKQEGMNQLTADRLVKCILAFVEKRSKEIITGLMRKTRHLRQVLRANVFGQDHAVNTFVFGYFQAMLTAETAKERRGPLATFLFAGPPGVGKTFLSEKAAKTIGLPFARFDMSQYVGANRYGFEDSVAGFVGANSKGCIVLIDEIEKAHQDVIYLFLQILDAGDLNGRSFENAILIFTTNAGKEMYDSGVPGNMSMISRKAIISALRNTVRPGTYNAENVFPEEICSRFATGNVVMFNHLDMYDLRYILARQLDLRARELQERTGQSITIDERLPSALLMAEGASVDARMARYRANAFWGKELYELFRLASSGKNAVSPETIRNIRFELDFEHSDPAIRPLLIPQGIPEAIAFTDMRDTLDRACRDICRVCYADDFESAKKLVRDHDVKFLFFTPEDRADDDALDRGDKDTPARRFLQQFMIHCMDVPVYILEDGDDVMSDEEQLSYFNRGVRGFLRTDSDDPDALKRDLREIVARSVEEQSMNELGRANKLIAYETRQTLSPDGRTATVSLFDMRLDVAVESGDTQSVVSEFSRPDVRFDKVIGAEEAKRELKYFVNYLKNPRAFKGQGVGTPRGVLLYGPPGTGKTMLAKALASESGLPFLSAQGHQFFHKYVGETEANVRKLFASARKYAPCILFIDEIDAIGRVRTGSEFAHVQEKALTVLLTEMDGFNTHARKQVFVLAATNYGTKSSDQARLDPALVRRFDRQIYVDLPDKRERRLFLETNTRDNPLYQISESELDTLADRSTGMSLAQLTSVLELALRSRVRDGKPAIDDRSVEEAFETFNGGARKKWSADQTLRTARHEAGHAFLNWYYGQTPAYVTIVSRGNFGGYMQTASDEDRFEYSRKELLGMIRTALGGRAAEIVAYGTELGLTSGVSDDLKRATRIARSLLCDFGMDERFGMASIGVLPDDSALAGELRQEINRILHAQLEEAVRLIRENWAAVEALADKLMKEDHLNGEEIQRVFSQFAEQA